MGRVVRVCPKCMQVRPATVRACPCSPKRNPTPQKHGRTAALARDGHRCVWLYDDSAKFTTLNLIAGAAMSNPGRSLSAPERHEARNLAANRRTVWLVEPVVDPATGLRVFGYDPMSCPPWLQEILDAHEES